jgi:hypothetical protein
MEQPRKICRPDPGGTPGRPPQEQGLGGEVGVPPGGASGVLKKLRENGLIRSDDGVYSLGDDFDKKIQPFLEDNSKGIEEIKETHRKDREDYSFRLEAWNRAWEDEAAIQKTAEDVKGSIYYLKVLSNSEARYHRVRLRMVHHYHLLKYGPGNPGDEGLRQNRACA